MKNEIISNIGGCFPLSNGVQMPYLGLGMYNYENDQAVRKAMAWAAEAGYRHFDTAKIYENESAVGQGFRESGLKREDTFIVSKVWNTDQGFENTLKAFDNSLNKLKLDYLDLYLIHWPVKSKSYDTWRALEKLYKEGSVRAIGVSNFWMPQLEHLLLDVEIIPMVNQIEFHPKMVHQPLLDFCRLKGIQCEAWSPLMRGKVFEFEILKEISLNHRKSIAQIVLRWNLQKGVVTIPKSSKQARILSNADLFDFELTEKDMHMIRRLDTGVGMGEIPEV